MNKKTYEKPAMTVYQLKVRQQLLTGSQIPVNQGTTTYQW